MSVNAGNPTFADDISLIALTPFYLQTLLHIVECYCNQWKVSINVDKSIVTVFTKKQTQHVVAVSYDGRALNQTASFIHLGVLYTFNLRNKDRIATRLQKAKNALFVISAQGVHSQGVNPLVSVGLYTKIILPVALYGSAL